MKRFLLIVCTLSLFFCCKNNVDISGITPSPFVGCWEDAEQADSIQNLSMYVGERGDSLFVAFYWDRYEPFYMTGNPLSDSKGNVIPQACMVVPKSGNMVVGTIVNQYFSVFQNYPKNEYYPLVLELKSLDTLVFKIDGEVNYWPRSGVLVRKNSENIVFSTEMVDLYKENCLVSDADVSAENYFDVAGIVPSPFVGEWGWEKSGSWESVKDHRGIGLIQGLEFANPVSEIIQKLLKAGVITFAAGANVIRFIPPLIVSKKEVDDMVNILKECI